MKTCLVLTLPTVLHSFWLLLLVFGLLIIWWRSISPNGKKNLNPPPSPRLTPQSEYKRRLAHIFYLSNVKKLVSSYDKLVLEILAHAEAGKLTYEKYLKGILDCAKEKEEAQ